jgi:hypothetical protein
MLLFRALCHSCHFILGTKFSWIWSQKVTGDLSRYYIISWWESPTIPRNVVRQFLSPLLKSRMQCVSVLLSLQLAANLQDFVVIPAIICRWNVVSVSYSYNLICICYKSIWANQVCTNPFDEIVIFFFFCETQWRNMICPILVGFVILNEWVNVV